MRCSLCLEQIKAGLDYWNGEPVHPSCKIVAITEAQIYRRKHPVDRFALAPWSPMKVKPCAVR